MAEQRNQKARQADSESNQHISMLRLRQVRARTGLSRSTIYALIKDGKFPIQVSLCGNRAVGWVEKEISDYLVRQVETSRKAAA